MDYIETLRTQNVTIDKTIAPRNGKPWTLFKKIHDAEHQCKFGFALLKVDQPSSFAYTVRVPTAELAVGSHDEDLDTGFMFGIASSRIDIANEEDRPHSCYLHVNALRTILVVTNASPFDMLLPGWDEAIDSRSLDLNLFWEGGQLYFSINDAPRIRVKQNLAAEDYRPCVAVCSPRVSCLVAFFDQRRKRKRMSSTSEEHAAQKLARTLWADKTFADAKVHCGDRTFDVHRCVLSAASPFFAAAFKGALSEARTADWPVDSNPAQLLQPRQVVPYVPIVDYNFSFLGLT